MIDSIMLFMIECLGSIEESKFHEDFFLLQKVVQLFLYLVQTLISSDSNSDEYLLFSEV